MICIDMISIDFNDTLTYILSCAVLQWASEALMFRSRFWASAREQPSKHRRQAGMSEEIGQSKQFFSLRLAFCKPICQVLDCPRRFDMFHRFSAQCSPRHRPQPRQDPWDKLAQSRILHCSMLWTTLFANWRFRVCWKHPGVSWPSHSHTCRG